jgi:excisionase family DNA binding protein
MSSVAREYNPEPLVVRPKTAKALLNCSDETLYQYLNSGELESYKEGAARKIPLESIRALVQRRLDEAKASPPRKAPTAASNTVTSEPQPRRPQSF